MKILYTVLIIAIITLLGLFLITQKQYTEIEKPFTRSTKNLPLAQATTIIDHNKTFQLEVNPIKKIINGNEIRMYGYNSQIPGPTIKVNQGETIFVDVINNLDVDTTIHWHGIRIKNEFDGIPSTQIIKPKESFVYEITFPDAGIYWYHPHVREDYQQELGLYGNILVLPKNENELNKVNREEFIFLDDIQLSNNDVTPFYPEEVNQVLMGRFGNYFLINGNEKIALTAKQGELIRLYFTNAANTRLFNVSIENHDMKIIGSDGGTYQNEFLENSIIISPSERATVEMLFDKPGTYNILHTTPYDKYIIGTITIEYEKIDEDYSSDFLKLKKNKFPLKEYKTYLEKEVDIFLNLEVDLPGMMGNMRMNHADESGLEWEDEMQMMNFHSTDRTIDWKITDLKTGKSNENINFKWKVGDKIKIRIINDPTSNHPMQHPIHLHGQRFLITSIDGKNNENLVWKDTVLVPVGKEIDILVDITNPGEWMAHCHIAEHLGDNMMFEFEVIQ